MSSQGVSYVYSSPWNQALAIEQAVCVCVV